MALTRESEEEEIIHLMRVSLVQDLEHAIALELRTNEHGVREMIQKRLEQAFRLNMHSTPLTVQGTSPGTTIDVPTYICQLAAKYEVPIPKM